MCNYYCCSTYYEGNRTLNYRIRKNTPALRYRMLSRDSFESSIFFLELLVAVSLDRRPTWHRVPPLNHLSSPYTLTSQKGRCMLHVISMHRLGDPRKTAISDLSKVVLCLVAPKFDHNTLVVRAVSSHMYRTWWTAVSLILCDRPRKRCSSWDSNYTLSAIRADVLS